ncbi:MAG TPA: hypothetical protein VLZ12_14950, partial [Verrucomicrobiae bacterium]|nr:hypothetical protein [Verrucomicrobiae bacterium]
FPVLLRPTVPVMITNASEISRVLRLFPGYDGPLPNRPAEVMRACDGILIITRADGARFEIRFILPRSAIMTNGIWQHPKGQVLFMTDDDGKELSRILLPYLPNDEEIKKLSVPSWGEIPH